MSLKRRQLESLRYCQPAEVRASLPPHQATPDHYFYSMYIRPMRRLFASFAFIFRSLQKTPLPVEAMSIETLRVWCAQGRLSLPEKAIFSEGPKSERLTFD